MTPEPPSREDMIQALTAVIVKAVPELEFLNSEKKRVLRGSVLSDINLEDVLRAACEEHQIAESCVLATEPTIRSVINSWHIGYPLQFQEDDTLSFLCDLLCP